MREGSPPPICLVSCVTCHVSLNIYIYFSQIGEASQWMVCYKQGLLSLVLYIYIYIIYFFFLYNIYIYHLFGFNRLRKKGITLKSTIPWNLIFDKIVSADLIWKAIVLQYSFPPAQSFAIKLSRAKIFSIEWSPTPEL